MSAVSINPFTQVTIKSYDSFTGDEITYIISEVQKDWLIWKDSSFDHRKNCLLDLAQNLKSNAVSLARLITSEMGKPVKQAEAEILKCAWVCEFYAENAEKILSEELIETDASKSFVRHEPLGIILAVMPWNFPFWQVFRFAAPALMAGNAAVLKHASNVSGCALEIEKLFSVSGFPENIFRTLIIDSKNVKEVIANQHIKAVTLTGSENAGISVAEYSGSKLKKSVLELGGSDPFIVFEDANIEDAAEAAVRGRILNNGQSCIAAKRFLISSAIINEFLPLFVKKMDSLKIGDPMKEETEIGPLAKEEFVSELKEQVDKSVKLGAKIITKRVQLPSTGYFFPPTILTNVKPGMPAYKEELFGPVAAVISFNSDDEAVRIANDTDFGLGASVWTNDLERAKKIAAKIDSGSVFINGIVKSDPRLPFGGIKKSGYGRELSSAGIKEFVNVKTIWIK